MRTRFGRVAAVAGMLVVGGCSGKSHEPPPPVEFSPAALSSSFAQGDDVAPIDLTITFNPALPGESLSHLFWFEQQPRWVLDLTNGYGAFDPQPAVWRMQLFPSCALEPGVYEGTLTFHVYDGVDVNGFATELPLAGNVLPYTFTVSAGFAPPRVTAAVDGVPQPGYYATVCGLSGGPGLSAFVGQTVTLTSTVPVTWSPRTPPCSPSAVNVSAAETTWTGTLGLAACPGSNVSGGQFAVVATPASDPARPIDVVIEVLAF